MGDGAGGRGTVKPMLTGEAGWGVLTTPTGHASTIHSLIHSRRIPSTHDHLPSPPLRVRADVRSRDFVSSHLPSHTAISPPTPSSPLPPLPSPPTQPSPLPSPLASTIKQPLQHIRQDPWPDHFNRVGNAAGQGGAGAGDSGVVVGVEVGGEAVGVGVGVGAAVAVGVAVAVTVRIPRTGNNLPPCAVRDDPSTGVTCEAGADGGGQVGGGVLGGDEGEAVEALEGVEVQGEGVGGVGEGDDVETCGGEEQRGEEVVEGGGEVGGEVGVAGDAVVRGVDVGDGGEDVGFGQREPGAVRAGAVVRGGVEELRGVEDDEGGGVGPSAQAVDEAESGAGDEAGFLVALGHHAPRPDGRFIGGLADDDDDAFGATQDGGVGEEDGQERRGRRGGLGDELAALRAGAEALHDAQRGQTRDEVGVDGARARVVVRGVDAWVVGDVEGAAGGGGDWGGEGGVRGEVGGEAFEHGGRGSVVDEEREGEREKKRRRECEEAVKGGSGERERGSRWKGAEEKKLLFAAIPIGKELSEVRRRTRRIA